MFVQVAEDDMVAEAEAETKAKGEAEVKAGLQRGGNKVRCFYCLRFNSCNPMHPFLPAQDSDAVQLDVTTKEKDSAKVRPVRGGEREIKTMSAVKCVKSGKRTMNNVNHCRHCCI